jgi:GNAT superfamily N-acetyltransferase
MIFSDLDLSRRLERAEAMGGARFVEASARLWPESGARWIEVAGAYAMFNGPASPVTQTFGLGVFTEPAAADLDRLEAFFHERGAPVSHEVSPLAGVALADQLARRGYRPMELTSVMYKPLTPSHGRLEPSNPRITTRLREEGEDDLWSRTCAHGWDVHPEFEEFLAGLGRVTASCEGAISFFACLDNEPVATAVLRCDGGVALLAGASTVPEARRQGAQRALLDARLNMAASQGCDIAMMCAEPGSASQRNAERQGFRIAYSRTKWRLDAPVTFDVPVTPVAS